MKVPITQSKDWKRLQDDLKETSVIESGDAYQFLAIITKTPVGNYIYCPYGPVAEDNRSFKKALQRLKLLAKENDAIFVRIEPQNRSFSALLPKNAKKTKDLSPKETWVLNLTETEASFKEKLPSRLLRYYKSAPKKGISIRKSKNPEDMRHLIALQNTLAKQKGINTFSEKYLKTELSQPFATLYLVEVETWADQSSDKSDSQESSTSRPKNLSNKKEVVAAGLVFDDDNTRYNLQGAQSELGRKLHATGILTIELIKDAREKGLETFDFWGIAPEGAPKSHPWAGFTEFKKSFKGEPKYYLGTIDLPLSFTKYKLYEFLRWLNRIRRKA